MFPSLKPWLQHSIRHKKQLQAEQAKQPQSPKPLVAHHGPFDPYTMEIETPEFPQQVPCFVEVSKESRNKYEWDHELGVICLDRVLHSAVYYPHDYGFIPQTLCGDGDPLDILVMSTAPLIPGCVVRAIPIAYLIMVDEKGQDEKVLAVNAKDAHFKGIRTMADLNQHTLDEIAEFFTTYKNLEKGKWAQVGGWHGTEETHQLIRDTHANFLKQFST
ncbi:hypothetical protein BASA81_000193 [Batrachochytrium salamandrivorans]|nr:hypothetical protein BASA81_000193 [Batrachochytrium salamandrivorans]